MNRVYKSSKLYCDITKIFEPFPPSVINYDQSVTFYSFHYSGTSITSAIYFMRASLNNTSVTLAPYQDIFIMTCFRATYVGGPKAQILLIPISLLFIKN